MLKKHRPSDKLNELNGFLFYLFNLSNQPKGVCFFNKPASRAI